MALHTRALNALLSAATVFAASGLSGQLNAFLRASSHGLLYPNGANESESLPAHFLPLAAERKWPWACATRVTGARSHSEAFGKFGIQPFVTAGGQKPLIRPAKPGRAQMQRKPADTRARKTRMPEL
jgi:hypothetical protein